MKRLSLLLLLVLSALTLAQTSHNGRLFDPAANTNTLSGGAPAELQALLPYLGNWMVQHIIYPTDSTSIRREGETLFTLMNRGHGFLEYLHCPDFNGKGDELNTATAIIYNPASSLWGAGVVDGFQENIAVYSGRLSGNKLILHNGLRRIGGLGYTEYRAEWTFTGGKEIYFTLSVSTDGGQNWRIHTEKHYRRLDGARSQLLMGTGYGSPAGDLPAEARAFDFLIGEYDAVQDLTLPNGQQIKFPSNTTAVFTLNGQAILEFLRVDVDTSLPDAATTIFRIYNRAMRRWESLYLSNRGHALLFFGGHQESDRIVLTNFETHRADLPLNHYVFHNIRPDAYSWFAERSFDHGRSYTKTWFIETKRKQTTPASAKP